MIDKTFTNNGVTKNKPTKKVAIYTSSYVNKKTKESYSNEEQELLLMEYCTKNNLEVYKCYSDSEISTKNIKNKPALEALLTDAEEKKFDMVIACKTRCIGKELEKILKIVDILDKNNITFKSLSEPFETETPAGKMQFQMMALVLEFQRELSY